MYDPMRDDNIVFSTPSVRSQYHVQCSAFNNQNRGENEK